MIREKCLTITIATLLIISSSMIVQSQTSDDDRFEVTLTSGETFTNCRILRTEPDGMVVMHSSGIRKMFYSELPADLRSEHEVEIPSYMTVEEATRYWPDGIDEVLAEVEANMTYWYSRVGHLYSYIDGTVLRRDQYTYEDGNVLQINTDVFRLRGEVLSVVDSRVILVIEDGEVFALDIRDTTNMHDGRPIQILGRKTGTFRYTTAIGSAKQVMKFIHVPEMPQIKFADFEKLGEDAFPAIASAKREDYQRILRKKKAQETAINRQRAQRAAQAAAVRRQREAKDEQERLRQKAERAERARKAAEAHREKFRMRGPEDFR